MKKVFIIGDTHGRFSHVLRAVEEHRPCAVISVGDIVGGQNIRPLEEELQPILGLTQWWWIPGNHDSDTEVGYDATFGSALADRNIHGKVLTIAGGLRIAGFGGVFREQVWMPPQPPKFTSPAEFIRRAGRGNHWRGGLPRRHRTSIFPALYDALKHQRADVLITHEAPSCHPYGFKVIDELARSLQVGTAFHGHHHDRLDYSPEWATLRFRAYGVGLCGISDLEGKAIVCGELDDAISHRKPQD